MKISSTFIADGKLVFLGGNGKSTIAKFSNGITELDDDIGISLLSIPGYNIVAEEVVEPVHVEESKEEPIIKDNVVVSAEPEKLPRSRKSVKE